jgi:translation elongation factor EF-G
MRVEVTVPTEFQNSVVSNLTKRNAVLAYSEMTDDITSVTCEVY